MLPYFEASFFNPSSPYAPAVIVKRDYREAKDKIAKILGVRGDELIMTAGATESINLAFNSMNGHVVIGNIEHKSVLAAASLRDYTAVASDDKGVISAESIAGALRPETQLVSVALANHELGTVQPLKQIAAVIEKERSRRLEAGDKRPIYLHTDASQGVGLLDINVARLGVDLLTVNAGKIYGPKQVGLLWAHSSVELRPAVVGGGQERGLRSGTENVAGVIGFARALELAEAGRASESKRLEQLRDKLQSHLVEVFPEAIISGSMKRRLPSFLHISWPGVDAERLIFGLEARNVLVTTGSACAANQGTRSHVLNAINLAPEVADGSLRITLGHLSTSENIDQAATIVTEVVKNEQRRIGQ